MWRGRGGIEVGRRGVHAAIPDDLDASEGLPKRYPCSIQGQCSFAYGLSVLRGKHVPPGREVRLLARINRALQIERHHAAQNPRHAPGVRVDCRQRVIVDGVGL